MKLLYMTTAALALTTTSALAFGAHQRDGFRDTGCDADAQVAVTSERTGAVLYYTNATCPAGPGATDAVAVEDDPDDEDDENGDAPEAS